MLNLHRKKNKEEEKEEEEEEEGKKTQLCLFVYHEGLLREKERGNVKENW